MNSKYKLTDKLPKHEAPANIWNRISSELDELYFDDTIEKAIKDLPVHKADSNVWGNIDRKINKKPKRILLYVSSIAAALTLFLGLSLVIRTYNSEFSTNQNPQLVENVQIEKEEILNEQVENIKTPEQPVSEGASNILKNKKQVSQKQTQNSVYNFAELNYAQIETQQPIEDFSVYEIITELENENNELAVAEFYNKPNKGADYQTTAIDNSQAMKKYYDNQLVSNNNFSLAVNYSPEELYNGIDNSMFHNFDVIAGIQKNNFKITSSVGLIMNTESYNVDVGYEALMPQKSSTSGDEESYTVRSYNSELTAKEQNRFFSYSFGAGHKLFSIGKFSAWINTSAGLAVKINKNELERNISHNINSAHKAKINSTSIEKPLLNNFQLNIITGLDFNYSIYNKLSLSVSPINRWYLKSVFINNGKSTDDASFGIRTGIKYNF